jgi:hypothetical protein
MGGSTPEYIAPLVFGERQACAERKLVPLYLARFLRAPWHHTRNVSVVTGRSPLQISRTQLGVRSTDDLLSARQTKQMWRIRVPGVKPRSGSSTYPLKLTMYPTFGTESSGFLPPNGIFLQPVSSHPHLKAAYFIGFQTIMMMEIILYW